MTIIKIDDIRIIPIHMNVIFMDKNIAFESNLDEKRMSLILTEIINDKKIILDFKNIKGTLTSPVIESIVKGVLDKNICLINMQESIATLIKEYDNDVHVYKNNHLDYCVKSNYFSTDIFSDRLIEFNYLKDVLAEKCKKNILKTQKFIGSSNVYTNRFFDTKKLFSDIEIIRLAVYLMAINLENVLKDNPKAKLVSSSLNGCVLATLISQLLKIEHISIPHLGPDISVEDNRYLDYIKKNDRLIYIYDFIALGNEQKTVSVIANLSDAEIIFSMGLSYYKPTRKEINRTKAIININSIIENMHITALEKDLEQLGDIK